MLEPLPSSSEPRLKLPHPRISTVVSVDGVGAFDLISRVSMMKSLRHAVDGESIIPFVRSFYGQPSTYFWGDDSGEVHSIPQGEGGEQGDPLMPLLFCLGQHPALAAVSAALQDGERLFAFLDDLYIVLGAVFVCCRPKASDAYTQTWLLTAF